MELKKLTTAPKSMNITEQIFSKYCELSIQEALLENDRAKLNKIEYKSKINEVRSSLKGLLILNETMDRGLDIKEN
ncbi:MAG: hypothetical protein AAF620_00385 [Bacteroidota bacterium]